MDDLLADFVAEAREMHDALANEIVAWEAEPGDQGRLDAIFRFFHTVKGNCGFFDFPRLEALAHAAEDALSDVRAGKRVPDEPLVDAVLAVLDRIAEMVSAIDQGIDISQGDDVDLLAALSDPHDGLLDLKASSFLSAADGPATERLTGATRSIRLPVDLLDRILSGVSDMSLVRADLARRIADMGGETGLEAPFNRLSTTLSDVRDAITRSRMQRIETVFAALPRLVRDLSAELGRQVVIELENGDVELDRELIELVRDPLVHVLRNAIDHGIEPPAERRAAGKREIGLITVSARQTGNEIRIGIIDDGRGVDDDRLVEKAIAAGIVTAAEAAAMKPEERFQLMCEPGISTADKVSSVSGRGVGMDVVRANLERIGGSIGINSTRGSGTRILLNVPLTLSVVPSLTIGVCGQKFAMPRSYVEEIVRCGSEEIGLSKVGGSTIATLRGRRLPCVLLNGVLGLHDADPAADTPLVIIRLVGGNLFALAVDEIFDHSELVVKPVAPALTRTTFYVGATQMDDGSPVLMLDISGVARVSGLLGEVKRETVSGDVVKSEKAREIPALLFTGFDGRRRVVPMNAVNRVEKVSASACRIADDGAHVIADGVLLPLLGFDDAEFHGAELEIFRIGDGSREIAYAVSEVADIVRVTGSITPVETGQPVAGITLIDGEPIEVLDCLKLLGKAASRPAVEHLPVCRMPTSDGWFDTFLRPIVEAAGYRVVGDDSGEAADLTILPDEAQALLPGPRENAIVLRSSPDETPQSAGTVYRYDRDALLDALHSARQGKAA